MVTEPLAPDESLQHLQYYDPGVVVTFLEKSQAAHSSAFNATNLHFNCAVFSGLCWRCE